MPRSRIAHYDKIRIHVYLRRPDAENYHQVRMVAYFHGTDFSVSPGLRILPFEKVGKKTVELFEPKLGRVMPSHPDATDINEQLQIWETKITTAFRKLAGPLGQHQVTRQMMDAELFPQTARPVEVLPVHQTFLEHYTNWVQEYTGIHTDSYLRKYAHVPEQLEQWRPGLLAGELSEKLVREWLKQLLKEKKSDGTISKHFKFFRLIAERLGLNPKASWLQYQEINAVQPDLTREELQALIRVRLDDARLEEERDRWLLQCLSGRRDADMQALRAEQVTELWTDKGQTVAALRHHQGKTTAEVLLPIPPLAVRIGERWGWQFPARANQSRNTWIKEVARRAGITRLFNDALISGGTVTDNYRPLCEVIGSHTARHTAGSLILEGSDGDKSLSSYLLGHSQGNGNTDIYAKDKARRVAPKLLNAWQQVLGELYDAVPTWAAEEPARPPEAKRKAQRKPKS